MVESRGSRGGGAPAPAKEAGETDALHVRTVTGVNTGLEAGRAVGKGAVNQLPPFTRLTRTFMEYLDTAVNADQDATEQKGMLLLSDLGLIEHLRTKLLHMKQTNQQEQQQYQQRQQQIEEQIEQVKQDIVLRKKQLQEARLHRQHLEEYEAVRLRIHDHPTRAATQQQIDSVKREMAELEGEAAKLDRAFERRRKQAALLFAALEDLTRVQDDQDLEPNLPLPTAAAAAGKEGGSSGAGAAAGRQEAAAAPADGVEAMEEGEAEEEGQLGGSADGEGPMQLG